MLLRFACCAALASILLFIARVSHAEDRTPDKGAPDKSAASEPQRGLAAISVPEGFTVEIAAAPPLVERPMLAAFDDRGRLYVCDSAGVNLRGPELSKNPPHVIRRLEDTDGNGRFDKSEVFADKLVFPQGIVWHQGAVFCSSPPSFWRLEDTDGNGQADQRTELVTGFANTGVADDMHGGSLGLDGRLYWCAGRFPHAIRRPGGEVIHEGTAPLILRCRPDGSELEVVCGSQGNAVGVAFSPAGDMFASGTFLAPNSMGAGLRDALVHCVDGAEYPVRDRELKEHRRTGDLLPPLTHLGVSASSDLLLCRAGQLGDGSRGDLFSALFNMHKITRHRLTPAGATYACRNEDFFVSSDPDFHPTDVFEDADGSMLVIDTGGWFRIGCPTSTVAKPDVLGAIYRVRRTDAPAVDDPRGLAIDWGSQTPEQLAALLGDARMAVSDAAIEQLAARGASAVAALEGLLQSEAPPEARCAAVWALTRIDESSARAAVRAALDSPSAQVRQAAARAAGLHRDRDARQALERIVRSDEAPARREAATALGRIGDHDAVPALLESLATVNGDRFLEHSVIFALIQLDDAPATRRGLDVASPAVKRGALIALDQMEGGGLTAELVTPRLNPAEPLVQQAALWVIAHHGDWGQSLVPLLGAWLREPEMDEARRDALRQQLLAFAGDTAVQQLVAQALHDSNTPQTTRLLLLEAIGQSTTGKLPPALVAPLRAALADSDAAIARQAIATARTLPRAKKPLVRRIDPTVDFGMVDGPFPGTQLIDDFSALWTGVVRVPQDGQYTFTTESDDGSQLFIDGKLVVDNGGSHAMRKRSGSVELAAGNHELRLEFIEEEGDAGCILSWEFAGRGLEVVPADALFHRGPQATVLEPGLVAEFFAPVGREAFPDPSLAALDAPLLRLANDSGQPLDVRAAAAAAVTPRLGMLEPGLFALLRESLGEQQPPLVRLDAADALASASLSSEQLAELCQTVQGAGVLELPRLVHAFEQSNDPQIGRQLVAALGKSPGLRSLSSAALTAVFAAYPDETRHAAEQLEAQLTVDAAKQRAKLAALDEVLSGGEIQRGRDLFFANQKAICATCHAVQGQGGKIGPDLTKIGAIRTPRDLLEAIVLPSASFARGYEPFTVATLDGQVHAGVIARETADAIHLVTTARAEIRLPRGDVETLAQSSVSIMPEGMDAQLSRQELSDLIAFLQSLR